MSPPRLVGSYPTFSPLPHRSEAVIFFYVNPAVADTLHINKRDALRCPDFPHTPQGSKRQTVQLLSVYKISARRAKYQIYLNISESQPNFKLRSRLKLCKPREKANLFAFFRRRGMKASVAPTGGLFLLRGATESSLSYLQAAQQIKDSATDE